MGPIGSTSSQPRPIDPSRPKAEPSAADARKALRGLTTQLTDPQTGRIKSGYLKLTPQGQLRAGFFYNRGSYSAATASIKEMLVQAYGRDLGAEAMQKLDTALTQYLDRRGGAIGTRSFVKLIRTLEQHAEVDDGQGPVVDTRAPITSKLELSELESDRHLGLNLSVRELKAETKSPIADSAVRQFQILAKTMSDMHPGESISFWSQDFLAFKGLMFPAPSKLNAQDAVQGPTAPRTFAMGDADGSMARVVLHAIASGVAQLPEDKMPALARLMSREIGALNGGTLEDIADFQQDPQVSQDLEEVAEALQVTAKAQDGAPSCMFLGDILSDRFTNNQQAMAKLIYKLSGYANGKPGGTKSDTGVRFIAGNHDTTPLFTAGGKEVFDSPESGLIWGSLATKKLSWKDYQDVLLNCFRAADYSGGVLTTHNGVRRHVTGQYMIGVGDPSKIFYTKDGDNKLLADFQLVSAKSPQELARKMNEAFTTQVTANGPKGVISTEFRPGDKDMTPDAMGFRNIRGFRQLHGHNASANEDHPGVTNLNARGDQGIAKFLPTATVIGYRPAAGVNSTQRATSAV